MTCRVSAGAKSREVRTKLGTLVRAQSQALSPQLAPARAPGPCRALNAAALRMPWHCASPGLPVLARDTQQAHAAGETA